MYLEDESHSYHISSLMDRKMKGEKGYVIDTTPHEVLLQYDDSAVENVVYTLKLKNKPEKPKLPQTGGGYKPWMAQAIQILLADKMYQ